MSAVLAIAQPHRIKRSHRRRGKVTSGRFVQRYYDPVIGRFLSPDSVETDPDTGESFNRYAYANNNPYSFTDPDGRQSRGVRFRASQVPRTSRFDIRTTAEAVHLAEGTHLSNTLQRLAPNRPLPSFVGPLNGPAYNQVTNQVLRQEVQVVQREIAQRIANNGHSFRKHIVQRGEFPGIRTVGQYENLINTVLNNYTHSGTGVRGQQIFYYQPYSTILIVNPGGQGHGGTAFQGSFARFRELTETPKK